VAGTCAGTCTRKGAGRRWDMLADDTDFTLRGHTWRRKMFDKLLVLTQCAIAGVDQRTEDRAWCDTATLALLSAAKDAVSLTR